MPTPKQVRFHFARVDSLIDKLNEAIWDAKRAGVIVYDDKKSHEESLGQPLYEIEIEIGFKKTTEAVLAKAMRQEIRERKIK